MANATPRAMTPHDITRIRFVSDPQLSPDGQRVAFVVTTLSAERDEYLSNIWVVDTAGGHPASFHYRSQDATPRRAGPQTAHAWPSSPSVSRAQDTALCHACRRRGAHAPHHLSNGVMSRLVAR